MAPEQHREC